APTKQPATAFTQPPAIQAAPEPAPAAAPAGRGMRQAIAATVSRSWQEIPHFNLTVEIDMQACREVVRELKGGDKRVGYQSLVIKGCSLVLQEFPRLLATEGQGSINIGFAVALPDGLLVPVVHDCQRRTPAEIEAEAVRLAERARSGHLTAEEMSGGGFTISNLGMYGVEHFNALIMPGQVGVLALGSVAERPVVRNGQLAVAVTLPVTLAADHRSVDGAYAAQFLKRLREILEQPLTLLV
ncbi:MAG TPA: dihydrolipoamide acetyltransferase family protein, partial [Stenomitos sp.]